VHAALISLGFFVGIRAIENIFSPSWSFLRFFLAGSGFIAQIAATIPPYKESGRSKSDDDSNYSTSYSAGANTL